MEVVGSARIRLVPPARLGCGGALGRGSSSKYPDPSMLMCGRIRSSQWGNQSVFLPASVIKAGTKRHTTSASIATAGQAESELLDRRVAVQDEAREHAEHDRRRRPDDAPE